MHKKQFAVFVFVFSFLAAVSPRNGFNGVAIMGQEYWERTQQRLLHPTPETKEQKASRLRQEEIDKEKKRKYEDSAIVFDDKTPYRKWVTLSDLESQKQKNQKVPEGITARLSKIYPDAVLVCKRDNSTEKIPLKELAPASKNYVEAQKKLSESKETNQKKDQKSEQEKENAK